MWCIWLAAAAVFLSSSGADNLPWWRTTTLYQIYPRSFKDSDGDGVGDLKGITQMADHFNDIGVGAIWISPIYQSPMEDMGYDIANFTNVDPLFGSMQDFDDLITKFKRIGVKVLMDMVPNHSSDEHLWFQASKDPSHPLHKDYKDFYVWKDPSSWNASTPNVPNNWISVMNGPAWTWVPARQQFYLHQFLPKQPDLNYRNPLVVGNMTDALHFWMDKGVDGFRVDAPKFLVEDANFTDDPPVPGTKGDTNDNLIHLHTENQPETFELLRHWGEVIYQRNLKDKTERSMWLEVYDPMNILMNYYGTGNLSMVVPFNFFLIDLSKTSRVVEFKDVAEKWLTSMPPGSTPNWVTGNHDVMRVADRFGTEMVDVICLFTGFLPGVKVTYYGEEIGMQDTFLRPDQVKDHSIFARDPFRSPMQWDDSVNAGFSSNSSTWLPINPNYWWLNVKTQQNSADMSHLKIYKEMNRIRKDPVIQRGDFHFLTPDNDTAVLVRHYNDTYFALVINFGTQTLQYTSLNLFSPVGLDRDMVVVIATTNSGYQSGTKIRQKSINITLRPKSAVLLRTSSACSLVISTAMLCLVILIPSLNAS